MPTIATQLDTKTVSPIAFDTELLCGVQVFRENNLWWIIATDQDNKALQTWYTRNRAKAEAFGEDLADDYGVQYDTF